MKHLLLILATAAVLLEVFPKSYAESSGAIGLRRPVNTATIIDTSSTSIGTSAYVTLLAAASVTYAYSAILISNAGTSPLKLATGAAGSEVDSGLVIPGSTVQLLPFNGVKGVRLSLRSLSGTQSSGIVTISFYQ